MKIISRLWILTFTIIIIWLYFLFVSPKIFNNRIVTIPQIVDLEEQQAIEILNKEGINYQITYLEANKNTIIKTIPYPNTQIKANYVVDVYVGKIMPIVYKSFLGQLYEDVEEQIALLCEKNNINLIIDYENTNSIEGIIIKESIVDGKILDDVTELKLTISKNDNSFLMPNLVGMNIDEALVILKEYGLKANLIYYQTPIDQDIIIFQSAEPNMLIKKNTSYLIDIYISKGITNVSSTQVDLFIDAITNLGYELEVKYVDSNDFSNKIVAIKIQKLYDNNVIKYILWITK